MVWYSKLFKKAAKGSNYEGNGNQISPIVLDGPKVIKDFIRKNHSPSPTAILFLIEAIIFQLLKPPCGEPKKI